MSIAATLRLISLAGMLAAASQAGEAADLRALLVSGSGVEERAAAAPLADAVRRAGRFAVFTTDDPGMLTPAALTRYDVLAVDCGGAAWTDAARRAVERFVRLGKGLAVVRTGDCASLPGAAERGAAPGDGGRRALRVRWADAAHPLAPPDGGSFQTVDDPGPAAGPPAASQMLMAARPEGSNTGEQPVAWTAAFGKGRVFHTRLGRNPAVRRESEFLDVFVRAVNWAATGKVAPQPPPSGAGQDARALVVTGGHTYDASFYTLFEDQPGIAATVDPHPMPYRRGDLRKRYDTLVLYDSMQVIDEAEEKNLRSFVESGKGVVILHHALVDYSDTRWWWEEVMGARWLKLGGPGTRWKTTYKHDVELLVYPVGEHPITAGVGPMRIWDETYKGMWLAPDIQVLMRTDDPSSDGPVVWISPYRKSRVVIIELGHDRNAHLHPGFRRLVRNAILWSAGKE